MPYILWYGPGNELLNPAAGSVFRRGTFFGSKFEPNVPNFEPIGSKF